MAPINPVNPVMLGGVPRGLVQVHSAPIAAEFDAADLPDSCALATLGRSWLVPSLAAFGEPLEVSPAAGSPPALPPFFLSMRHAIIKKAYAEQATFLCFAVFDDVGNVGCYTTCRVQLDRGWRSSFPPLDPPGPCSVSLLPSHLQDRI